MSNSVHYRDYAGNGNPPVPDEAHKYIFKSILPRFNSESVSGAFEWVIKNKLFGNLHIVSAKDNRIVAKFEFQSGMCKKYNLFSVFRDGKRVCVSTTSDEWFALFDQSIFNKGVSFSKTKGDESWDAVKKARKNQSQNNSDIKTHKGVSK